MSLITIDCIELNAIEKLIHAGAKRLIFSLSFVSARPCCCLDLPQLREAIDLVHKYDCEAAINFTRFFMEEELNVCEKMLLECHRMNADIFYFTDMCVLQLAQLHGFADKCIYDPQTLITNASDAQFYLDEGIHGVTVSNQITLEEICEIGKNTRGNCEVMIHGRMLMMHSKRRLLSSYFEFVHMENNKALILTDAIEGKGDIDLERAKKAYARARARIDKKDSATNLKRAQLALEKAINRINVYGG